MKILNPNDSQGNQIAWSKGTYPTLRGCGGAGYQQGYLLDDDHAILYNRAKNDIYEESEICMSVIARFGTGGNNMPIVRHVNR